MIGYYLKGFKLFHFVDDIFGYSTDRAYNLAKKISRRLKPDIEWVFNLRVDGRFMKSFNGPNVRFSLLKKYFQHCKNGCCAGISIGVESGDERLLKSLG